MLPLLVRESSEGYQSAQLWEKHSNNMLIFAGKASSRQVIILYRKMTIGRQYSYVFSADSKSRWQATKFFCCRFCIHHGESWEFHAAKDNMLHLFQLQEPLLPQQQPPCQPLQRQPPPSLLQQRSPSQQPEQGAEGGEILASGGGRANYRSSKARQPGADSYAGAGAALEQQFQQLGVRAAQEERERHSRYVDGNFRPESLVDKRGL